jgi:hypothetical protein
VFLESEGNTMTTVAGLYDYCRRKIGHEIGYLPHQVASAWAAGRVEAIASQIHSARHDHLDRSLTQLYVATLCLAHEYYVPLTKEYAMTKLPHTIAECVLHADEAAASDLAAKLADLVRDAYATVAFYHGWPKPITHQPLAMHILQIHRVIYAIAKCKKVDLEQALFAFLHDANSDRALARYRNHYSPITTPVLNAFQKIKDSTVCIFSQKTNVWGALPPDSRSDLRQPQHLEAFLESNRDIFTRLSQATRYERVDAFLLMLPPGLGDTLPTLTDTMRSVLDFYAATDPSGVNCAANVGDPKWRYKVCGMDYFVQAFAPFYGAESTRYTYGINQVFIQFVSDAAFKRYIPEGQGQSVRDSIREKADNTGQPYEIHEQEADNFVVNLHAGMPPVRWYEKTKKAKRRMGK